MLDLLGDPIDLNPPEDPQDGFNEFWQAYPSGPRKVGKPQALKKWVSLGLATKTGHIVSHVHHMKTEDCWLKDGGRFVCGPVVYLNQQRWLDWTPPAPVKPRHDVLAELKAHVGTKPSAETLARIARIKQGITA